MPFAVLAATLLVTGDLYTNRCDQTDAKLYQNLAAKNLLMPFKDIAGVTLKNKA